MPENSEAGKPNIDLPRATTQLTIVIEEDGTGSLQVSWQALLKGTQQKAHMRPAHIVGQMISAAFIILAESYESLRGDFEKARKRGRKEEK